jgi:hypothetical protein
MGQNTEAEWTAAKQEALERAHGECKCESEKHDHSPLLCSRKPDGKHYAFRPGCPQAIPNADFITAVCRPCHSMNLRDAGGKELVDAKTWATIRMQVWDETHSYCQCSRFEHQHKHRQCLTPITMDRFKLVVQPLGDTTNFAPANLWGVCAWCFEATPLGWRISESAR